MRIAMPLENDQIAHHLGHCPQYLIAEIRDNTISTVVEVANPRHGPGGPPPMFLAQLGVTHVIGWGAPAHFLGILSKLNIKYTLGAKGPARQVLEDFLAGTLVLVHEGLEVQCGHDH